MKHLNVLNLILGLMFSFQALSQAPTINGYETICPGNPNAYAFSVPSNNCWTYIWTTSSGAFITGGGQSNLASIKFSNSFISGQVKCDIYAKAEIAGCTWVSYNLVFNVKSVYGAPNTSISGPSTVSCQVPVEFETQFNENAIYTWVLPTGWQGSSFTNKITVTPDGVNSGYIKVTEQFPDGWCNENYDHPTIQKFVEKGLCTPAITNNNICCAKTICYNTSPGEIGQSTGSSLGGGTGTFTYQWQSSTNGTTYANAVGASTNPTYTPTSLTSTTWYKRVVKSGNATSESPAITITVLPNTLTVNAASYSQSTIKQATSLISIQGDQTSSSSIQVDFISNGEIKVLPSTVLKPNISLKIQACPTNGSGLRLAEQENPILINTEPEGNLIAYPNPSNNRVVIKYKIKSEGFGRVNISDEKGKVIAVLVDKKNLTPGDYETTFNSSDLSAGIYLYSLETNTTKEVKRLIIQH